MKHRSRSSPRRSGTKSLWYIIHRFISLTSYQKKKRRLRSASKLLAGITSTAMAGLISLVWWNLYQKPKVDTWHSQSAIFWANAIVNGADNNAAVFYDLTNRCRVQTLDVKGSNSDFKTTPPQAQLFSTVELLNTSDSQPIDTSIAFHSTIPGPIEIESSANLTVTHERVESDYAPAVEVVRINNLQPGADGVVTASIELPDSAFAVWLESRAELTLLQMSVNYPSVRIDPMLLDPKQAGSSRFRPMGAEEAFLRKAELAGGTTVELPSKAKLFVGGHGQFYEDFGQCAHQAAHTWGVEVVPSAANAGEILLSPLH
jgi:hypothetical protein